MTLYQDILVLSRIARRLKRFKVKERREGARKMKKLGCIFREICCRWSFYGIRDADNAKALERSAPRMSRRTRVRARATLVLWRFHTSRLHEIFAQSSRVLCRRHTNVHAGILQAIRRLARMRSAGARAAYVWHADFFV